MLRPEPPRRPELRHLLEEVVVRVEEEREPLAERRPARAPASTAARQYAIPFASVNASSWTAVEPASRMWYPEIEIVFQFGSRSAQ